MSFDIRQLQYAIAAADHGSFYRAARALDIEQSSLSRSISKLERSIGIPIFERSRAGVSLTLAGDAFIESARPMVASAQTLVVRMRAASQGRAGGLRLGHNSAISAGNLRATLASWVAAYPGVEVECLEADRAVLHAGVDTGQIDIAILMGAGSQNGCRCESFWGERIFAAMPVSHPLAEQEAVNWADLRSERFLLPAADPGSEFRNIILSRLALSGASQDIRMRQSSREALMNVLGICAGISVVCEGSTGSRYPDVVYRPISGEQGPALVSFSGCWRDDNGNPALRRFLRFIKARYALSFDFSA